MVPISRITVLNGSPDGGEEEGVIYCPYAREVS